jgi:cytochrome c biogenesis protein CcmG, thiol:disulfide interchange protein DsbE
VTARSRTPLVIVVVIVVVAVAGLLAVVLTRDSDDSTSGGGTATTATGDDAPAGQALIYGAVETSGEPLPDFARGAPDPAIGMTPPTITGTTYAGEPIEVVPGESGPTMVVFLAHWCPVCNAEIPVLNEWRDSGAVPADLEVIGVSTAVTDQRPNFPPAQWLADRGWTFPTMADDEAASALAAYGGTGFPFFVVLGADGTVKARNVGELPVDQLDALVDAALA